MSETQPDLNASNSFDRKKRLKQLLDQGMVIGQQMSQKDNVDTLEAIQSIIEESDAIISEGDIVERAHQTAEVVLDTQVVKMNHELLSKVLEQTGEFAEHLFQEALIALMKVDEDSDELNWDVVAEMACKIPNTACIKSSMLGSIEVQQEELSLRKRQKRQKAVVGDEKRPETVNQLKRKDKGAQKINIAMEQFRQLYKAHNNQAIPFYKLVIDPDNFMNSVDNAFQLAFLVRDSVLAVEAGPYDYPYVRICSEEERSATKDNSQDIFTLNEKVWREMIAFYSITEPMLRFEYNEIEDSEEEQE